MLTIVSTGKPKKIEGKANFKKIQYFELEEWKTNLEELYG